jgi:hypothetical protein
MKTKFDNFTNNQLVWTLNDIKSTLQIWRDYDNDYTKKLNKELDDVRFVMNKKGLLK